MSKRKREKMKAKQRRHAQNQAKGGNAAIGAGQPGPNHKAAAQQATERLPEHTAGRGHRERSGAKPTAVRQQADPNASRPDDPPMSAPHLQRTTPEWRNFYAQIRHAVMGEE
jgi:hypothetical protein